MRISVGLVLSVVCTAAWADDLLPSFGGRFQHLAVSNARGECGIGAVVPWADRLWLTAYAPHARHGSDDKLYSMDDSLRLTARPESVGGTPAARFINDATRQSVIGPYVIDRQGTVRPVPPKKMEGRISAAAAHPLDPAGKVLVYDMEGLLYELAMRSLETRLLVARAVPGWHGKGMYAGQGGVVHLAHGADTPVTFTLSAGAGTAWQAVATVDVQPGSPTVHEFPTEFLAQWVRFTADAPCRATATLTYR